MRLSNIEIKNYRNFSNLSVPLGKSAVIVGENKVGKSNLLQALRLLLDPTLPDSERMLTDEDFWDGLERPLKKTDYILISIQLADFEDNDEHLAYLQGYLISGEPAIAELSYLFRPKADLEEPPKKTSDYEHLFFGGKKIKNSFDYRLLRRFPMTCLPALRDAETDLASWKRSPLRPLLEETVSLIDRNTLETIANKISDATNEVTKNQEIANLAELINTKFESTVGGAQALQMKLMFSPTDPDALPRSLRIFIDEGKRQIGAASLGSTNLVYLTLKLLELQQLTANKDRLYTFLAIEEPEAHLHPQLQRLVYRDVLRPRTHQAGSELPANSIDEQQTSILVTTHSPHIVSVSPLKSIVILRQEDKTTTGYSLAEIALDEQKVIDLENYINVTRGEILFAKSVILVEGDAELFILPSLAIQFEIDFDKEGITVCSVSGADFAPYASLLRALKIPYVVLTDYDRVQKKDGTEVSLGIQRIKRLMKEYAEIPQLEKMRDEELIESGIDSGFFVNNSTLELELWYSGLHKEVGETLTEFVGSKSATTILGWIDEPSTIDEKNFLARIERIGKGRFAQRLTSQLKSAKSCPKYIIDAFKYIIR